jgi:hypothetical protein
MLLVDLLLDRKLDAVWILQAEVEALTVEEVIHVAGSVEVCRVGH